MCVHVRANRRTVSQTFSSLPPLFRYSVFTVISVSAVGSQAGEGGRDLSVAVPKLMIADPDRNPPASTFIVPST